MATSKPLAEVELRIPSRPEYVGVARLAILGVASRMRFSYDEVEDIRLAVGEACTRAIDRINGSHQEHVIRLCCLIDANRLTLEVRHPLAPAVSALPVAPHPQEASGSESEKGLSDVLIRILMDEVETDENTEPGTHILRMVKYVAK